MKLQKAIQNFYFDMSISELKQMNESYTPSITYNSLLYLDVISFKKNCTVSYLAKALNISKSAVTIKINELIKQGLVVKEQSAQDKRVFFLHASENAKTEYQKFHVSMRRAAANVEEKFAKGEIETFCKIMSLISEEYKIEVNDV